jgi:hypothetical protein
MKPLAIQFKTTPDRVFAHIPSKQGRAYGGRSPFACYSSTGSEQCPGCGADIAEHWTIESVEVLPRVAPDELDLGEGFHGDCKVCGYSMTGTVVEMER